MTQTPGRLAEQVAAILASARVPGCSIVLVDNSGIVWSEGFGFADVQARRPATPATVYHLFSGTKLFTATAVLQLAERGALELDDPVTKFLPQLDAARDIRLRHLLSHQSGLRDTLKGFLTVSWPPDTPPTAAEALARYRIAAARPPGGRVEYRNVNYALLGAVVSRAAGMEYREYVTRYVLAPLGIRAAFSLTDELRSHAATGYIGRWDPMRLVLRLLMPDVARKLYRGRVDGLVALRDYDLATAAIGGLVGSMSELAKFLVVQLGEGGAVLSAESMKAMQALVVRGAAGIEAREGTRLEAWPRGRTRVHQPRGHRGRVYFGASALP